MNMENQTSTGTKSDINKKLCKICGDWAPRIYYGALACDGCKSFFRRAVRGGHVYKCRFDRDCNISKDRRTQCRHCRLKKCLKAGMRKEAIQSDRDPIRSRILQDDNPNALTLTTLMHADELVKEQSGLALGTKILEADDSMSDVKIATLTDNNVSLREQLLVMVTWAKSIPAFCELPLEDKVALLQARSGEYATLVLARRSLPLNDVLVMGNGCLLTRESTDVLGITPRVLDELVVPFRALNMDDTEYAVLKAILFFDPSARGLRERERIEALRMEAQVLLEEYVRDRQLEPPGRLSNMLLRLLNLQSITAAMSEEMEMRRRFGITSIDKLLRQMVLGEDVRSDSASDSGMHEDSSSPVLPSASPSWTCNSATPDSQTPSPRISESHSISSCGDEDYLESS